MPVKRFRSYFDGFGSCKCILCRPLKQNFAVILDQMDLFKNENRYPNIPKCVFDNVVVLVLSEAAVTHSYHSVVDKFRTTVGFIIKASRIKQERRLLSIDSNSDWAHIG